MDQTTLLQRLRPVLGDRETEQVWEQLQLADSKTAKLIEFSLRRRLAQAVGTSFEDRAILLEPPPAEKAGGDAVLGTVMYSSRPLSPFALRRGELIQHTAIFGRSGAGKTNVAFLLLRELSRLGIPFLVFDWKKNYRDLLADNRFRRLVIYTVGRDHAPFFFNPLVPPKGSEPREWLKKLIEVMQHAYFLGEGVAFVLQEVVDQLYRDFGVYDDSGRWPTLRDLLTMLRARKVKGREAAWMESALRAIGVLCFGAMDWVLNAGTYLPLQQLLQQQAVLELDALTNSDKTFLIESLLLWIHHHRMNEPGREELKHVLLIEEAHHVLLKKKQELTGAEAVTDVILREVREFGEAIVLLDQLPSLISKPALENSYTTICMNLKEKGDVTAAAKAMLLESDEARYLGRVDVGWGIVRLQSRWPKPFLVRFPLFTVRKGTVDDQQVKARFLDHLDVETIARTMSDGVLALRRLVDGSRGDSVPSGPAATMPDEEGRLFLQDVADHPVSPVTERYARLHLNPKRGTSLTARLIENGSLRSVSVPIPGSHLRLLELTRAGRQTLGLSAEHTDRGGGLEHRYWVERIAGELARAGVSAEKEAPLGGGRAADILATIAGKRIAIEVETGKSDWKNNVQKCLEAGMDRVVAAPTRRSLYRAMEPALQSRARSDRIRLIRASQVVASLTEES